MVSSAASPTATTSAELTPTQILTRASTSLAATKTVKFSLKVSGETFIDKNNTIQLLEANGSLIRPDKVYTEFRVKLMKSVTVSMKLITIGLKHWSTDLITGNWVAAPEEFGYDPKILFDNQKGIGPVMNRITDATNLGIEQVHGRDCFHIKATAQQSVIGPLTSNTMQGDGVGVELWIDVNNFNLLQAKLSESTAVTDHQPAVWVLKLTNQDDALSIDAPNAPFSLSSPVASPLASPVAGSGTVTPSASPGAHA